MKRVVPEYLQLALRVLIGGVFVYAGALKLQDPISFSDSVASFSLLPNGLINLVALGLPIFEVLAGVLLISGFFPGPVTLSLLLLSASFGIALAQALARGLSVDCGCFGGGEPSALKTWTALGRDVLLLCGCAWLYLNSRSLQGRHRTEEERVR